MTEAEKRKYRCCFTGHRPEKLTQSEEQIRTLLEEEIKQTISEGINVFITGMARGVDIWAAEAVIKLRNQGSPIRLICACPYPGFESNWSSNWKMRYHKILDRADLVRYISPYYHRACFQTRNEWMVNHAAKVIAVFNGEPGGTRNTILYAEENHIPCTIIRG